MREDRVMAFLTAPDGTRLAYHRRGEGPLLLCVPGGPLRDSGYLDTLGGLDAHRELVFLDLRGSGSSALPQDPTSYRCDRQVDDVGALRRELGVQRLDLLAHSAGAEIAVQYAARYPEHIGRLVLVTPSTASVGFEEDPVARVRAAGLRADQEWFPAAYAALERVAAGEADAESWAAVTPFSYGRWDATAQAHAAASAAQRQHAGAPVYFASEAFDPPATRAALAKVTGEVLVLAGELDGGPVPERAAELAALFPRGSAVVQRGAAHFPWLDDPERFVSAVNGFLRLR